MNKFHIDIIGMSETNLKWNKFSCYDRLTQRTSKWWENTHCSFAYNSHDVSSAKFQPGGTAILTKNQLSHKVQSPRKQDPTGLGRWTSTLYQGKQNKLLRIIQVYRPCKPNPHSANGVYQQHSRYFLTKNIQTCPRMQFLTDLRIFITQCQQSQEHLIVMGDFNDPVTQAPISAFFTSLGMHNILHSYLGSNYTSSPVTYNRGNSIIDGAFASHGISATRAGYLPSHSFESDHTPIWFDLSLPLIFGTTSNIQLPLHCRRLKNEDPRVVQKFNSTYQQLLIKHQLPVALSNLSHSIHHTLTPLQQQEYERLDKIRVQCLLAAEKKCRKLKTGAIEFSPTIQHQRNLIRFWKLLFKRRTGHKIDTKYLSRWERKLNLNHTFNTPIANIRTNIKNATIEYKRLKKEHSTLRDEWISQLAAARAEAGSKDSATELSNLRQKERIRMAHRQIRWCLHHDSTTGPITEVTEVINDVTLHHHDQSNVENAILKANNNKFRQTNDTPPMTSLLPIIGFLGTTPAAQQILQGTYNPPPSL